MLGFFFIFVVHTKTETDLFLKSNIMMFFQLKTLAIIILITSVLQGIIVVFSKGSIRFQKPEGGLNAWIYNIINLLVLIVLTPILSILLLKEILSPIELVSVSVPDNSLVKILEAIGLVLYIFGNLFIYLARIVLWNSFRLGAVAPESKDKLIVAGPFRLVRHPMYFAVIIMCLGLALLLHSWLFLVFFIVLYYTIIKMIPVEENQLINAYGDDYINYKKKVKKLFPYIY